MAGHKNYASLIGMTNAKVAVASAEAVPAKP